MERKRNWPSALEALPILLLIIIAALLPAAIFLGSGLISYLGSLDLPQIPDINQSAPPNAAAQPDPDAQLYYRLKNASCASLSENFLIEAADVSEGEIYGLLNSSAAEGRAAQSIASQYDYRQAIRTYVRGDAMKRIIETGGIAHTTIWKEGRIYQCNPNCTMHLLGDSGWQAHLDSLEKIRTDCQYFGKTNMPSGVNMSRLLKFNSAGRKEINGFRCEDFQIFGNRTYANSLLASNVSLSEDQRALLWAIAHLSGPVRECLDDGTGITIRRSISLDLTESYLFDYAPGGHMRISQETNITYFTSNVPESFLALPS